MSITKQDYFDRRVNLLSQIEDLKNDLKQLQEDSSYDADTNPKGLDKATIKRVNKAAALEVAEKYEDYREEVKGVMEEFDVLTGYNA